MIILIMRSILIMFIDLVEIEDIKIEDIAKLYYLDDYIILKTKKIIKNYEVVPHRVKYSHYITPGLDNKGFRISLGHV